MIPKDNPSAVLPEEFCSHDALGFSAGRPLDSSCPKQWMFLLTISSKKMPVTPSPGMPAWKGLRMIRSSRRKSDRFRSEPVEPGLGPHTGTHTRVEGATNAFDWLREHALKWSGWPEAVE